MAIVYTIEPVQSAHGAPLANVRSYPVKASETFKKGDPVILDTNGQVLAAPDNGNLIGIALQDAPSTALAATRVLVVSDDMLFSASQSNAGATQNSAQTQVGLQCSYIKSTITGHTAKMTVDTADTTTPSIEIIDLDPRDPAATADGRVIFRFLNIAAR